MFDQTTYSGSEGGSPVSLCAEITDLMGTLDCDIVVTFAASPGDVTGMAMFLNTLFLHNNYGYQQLVNQSAVCTRQ